MGRGKDGWTDASSLLSLIRPASGLGIPLQQQTPDLPAGGDTQLTEDVLVMLLEGGVPHLEGFGDLPVFPEAGEHLQQLVSRVVRPYRAATAGRS